MQQPASPEVRLIRSLFAEFSSEASGLLTVAREGILVRNTPFDPLARCKGSFDSSHRVARRVDSGRQGGQQRAASFRAKEVAGCDAPCGDLGEATQDRRSKEGRRKGRRHRPRSWQRTKLVAGTGMGNTQGMGMGIGTATGMGSIQGTGNTTGYESDDEKDGSGVESDVDDRDANDAIEGGGHLERNAPAGEQDMLDETQYMDDLGADYIDEVTGKPVRLSSKEKRSLTLYDIPLSMQFPNLWHPLCQKFPNIFVLY